MDQASKPEKEEGSVGVPPVPEAGRQDDYAEYSTESLDSDSDSDQTPIMSETEEATTPKPDVKKEKVVDNNANEQVLPDSTTDDAPEASATTGAQAAAEVAYDGGDESSESSHGSLWTPEGEENSDTSDGESGSGGSGRKPATVSESSDSDGDEEWLPAGAKKRKPGKQKSKKGSTKRSK